MKIDNYNVIFTDENGIKTPPSKYKNYTDRLNSENEGVTLTVKKEVTNEQIEVLKEMYVNCAVVKEVEHSSDFPTKVNKTYNNL